MNLTLPLESKRMKYRLMAQEDAAWIYRQFSDPDMCTYYSEPPCTLEQAKQIIEHYRNPVRKDHLRLVMIAKDTGAFIGTCGYHYWDQEKKQVEIGYDVWKEYWRQGYMSEALPVLLTLCFEHLDVDSVYVFTHPLNTASQACVKKFGFKECEPCRPGEVEPSVCMKLLRKDWLPVNKETNYSNPQCMK